MLDKYFLNSNLTKVQSHSLLTFLSTWEIPLFSTRWATSSTVSSIWDFRATDPFISISKQLFVCVYYFREGWISHWLLFQATDFHHRPSWAGLAEQACSISLQSMEVSTVLCTSPGPGVDPILRFSFQHMMWGELIWLLSLSVCLCIYLATKSREAPVSAQCVNSRARAASQAFI